MERCSNEEANNEDCVTAYILLLVLCFGAGGMDEITSRGDT